MKELLLGAFLAGDELDVVHQQHVHRAVALAEGVHPVRTDGADQVVGEGLGGKVLDHQLREALPDVVAHGVHQVGLAKAHAAVDEEGVVGLTRRLGHRQGGGVGHFVAVAHHEALEGVLGVEAGARGGGFVAVGGLRRWRFAAGYYLDAQLRRLHPQPQERLLDELAVVFLDPVAGKARGHRQVQTAPLPRQRPHPAKPGLKLDLGHAVAQVTEHVFPDALVGQTATSNKPFHSTRARRRAAFAPAGGRASL